MSGCRCPYKAVVAAVVVVVVAVVVLGIRIDVGTDVGVDVGAVALRVLKVHTCANMAVQKRWRSASAERRC